MSYYGPFYNPPVPFTTHFHSGIKEGTVVIVNGSIPPSADRFAVNFKCGHGDNDDIAFHFNPRFDHKTVVCNTMQHKNWETEEVKSQLPFYLCQPFEIRILVTSCVYKCGIPQQPCPGGQNPPPCNPGVCPPPHYAIPFQTNIHGGLFPCKVIVIRGAVAAHHPQRFHIDLTFCGGIAFHFNPRFNENTIVRNSRLNNCWGKEERDLHCGGLCFAPGQSFVIEIICEHHNFRVNVNGNHVCNFNHRVPNLQQINSLEVDGDVVLQHVQV